jgi:hypothetical protein
LGLGLSARRPTVWALLACGACHADPPAAVPQGSPIVVFWTLDTLGAKAAAETGWCERLGTIASAHGLDVACVDGGVPPSSWTGESHTRMLWPQSQVGARRSQGVPACDAQSALELVADARAGAWIFGADNSVFGSTSYAPCDDGRQSWLQRTDSGYVLPEGARTEGMVEAERPVHFAIDDALAQAATGESVSVFLNTFEAGGHVPRCWFDPHTAACEALWRLLVDAGTIPEGADPVATWIAQDTWRVAATVLPGALADDLPELRNLYWTTMVEAIEHHRVELVDERLERLLSGIEDLGRLDDLLIVITSDHGENPCVWDPYQGYFNCGPGDLATEWTALVPLYVIPAAPARTWQAAGYIGDGAEPFSTVNLSYALLQTYGVSPPPSYPPMELPGAARTWHCREGLISGVRILGDASLRCSADACQGWTWAMPTGLDYEPEPLAAAPETFTDDAAWAGEACSPDP